MESKNKQINKKQELQFSYWIKQILKQQRYSGKRINATTRANDPKYIRTHPIQEHPDTSTSILDRSTGQKINKDIQDLNSDLEQVNFK